MAARLWRWVLAGTLLGAAGSAALLQHAWALAAWSTACVALAFVAATPLLCVAASFAIARVHDRRGWRASQLRRDLRALFSEFLHFSLAVARMSADPRERPWIAPATGRTQRPVLLIHGILCNRGVWRRLLPLLRRAGFGPVRAVNLEPLCAGIESHARRLAPQLLELQSASGGAPVRIVAHSMGGLVARALLRHVAPQAVERVVTVGSPHHGTAIARGLRWPATRDMAPDSAVLAALGGAEQGGFPVPVCSLYSLEDNLITPARSARLAGARCHELRGIGHLGLLGQRPALDRIIAALQPAGGA
jgi:predicted alpha/beta hydrolase family esterase